MIKKLLLLFCTAVAINAIAQDSPKNVVSLNLFSLSTGTISLKYERAIKPWCSARIHAGYMLPHEFKALSNQLNSTADEQDQSYSTTTSNIKTELNGWHIKPEFVFYTGSEAVRGYYIGLYGKIDRYSITFPVTVDHEKWKETGGINRIGGGMIMGYQWLIADKVSIDWYFLGLGIDSYTFDFKAKSNSSTVTNISQADLDDAEQQLSDAGLSGFKAEKTSSNSFKITSPSKLFPCFRTGLSIGYAF